MRKSAWPRADIPGRWAESHRIQWGPKVDDALPGASTHDERRSIGALGISDRRTSFRAVPFILPEHENSLNADSIDSTQNLLSDLA